VIGQIAGTVISVERQHDLVALARGRLSSLGYDNVQVREGDGTRGCAEEAPFDAILAAASGSHVPQSLIDQLGMGGRLVMPVGDPGWVQKLVKVTKAPDGKLVTEDLGGVRFVPLIGDEGWENAGGQS
jgi:protein-L-isoaspartate(D-aspartate) O-methyltransferase